MIKMDRYWSKESCGGRKTEKKTEKQEFFSRESECGNQGIEPSCATGSPD